MNEHQDQCFDAPVYHVAAMLKWRSSEMGPKGGPTGGGAKGPKGGRPSGPTQRGGARGTHGPPPPPAPRPPRVHDHTRAPRAQAGARRPAGGRRPPGARTVNNLTSQSKVPRSDNPVLPRRCTYKTVRPYHRTPPRQRALEGPTGFKRSTRAELLSVKTCASKPVYL